MDGGRHPAKRIQGEPCVVEADVFRDGHELLRAVVKWRRESEDSWAEAPMAPIGNDRWQGEFPLAENARYVFTVEAWTDAFASFAAFVRKKIAAGQRVDADVAEGVALVEAAAARGDAAERALLSDYAAALRATARLPRVVLAILEEAELSEVVLRLTPRADATVFAPALEVVADRPRARFSTWYELFPRSCAPEDGRHGTFRDVVRRLPELRDMGFDVLYLPPIHPIGRTNRKGRDNALVAGPGDPGSPWAIGSEAGGHDAVEPALGTLHDFDKLVAVARRLGIEVALDFALQCSPDHPWIRERPQWFARRPDGSIKYAENPPKRYEDVHPIDFDTGDRDALWLEIRRVLFFWIERDVRIFRVDNPHTKPIAFWEWLLAEVRREHPDVIFLSEAFTRPKVMNALAKAGFTQSYTYFTWRNTKREITEYLVELTQTSARDFFRPCFWPNTPDILPVMLQEGGRAAFKMRLVLAATLSPSYGIYSGYELCESAALPGREEYARSEKYEVKRRDWSAPGIKDYVALVNRIRRENPALQLFRDLRFIDADAADMLAFVKATPGVPSPLAGGGEGEAQGGGFVRPPPAPPLLSSALIVVVNLDPFAAHECTVTVPAAEIGVPSGASYEVRDLLTDAVFRWGERNYVRLDPAFAPAHILRVERVLP